MHGGIEIKTDFELPKPEHFKANLQDLQNVVAS